MRGDVVCIKEIEFYDDLKGNILREQLRKEIFIKQQEEEEVRQDFQSNVY